MAWAFLVFIAVVLASYLPYEPFNAWWFVRFMLPAYPPLLVLTAVSLVALVHRLPSAPRVLVALSVVGVVAWHGLRYARDHDVFEARSERKYAVVADYVVRRLPERAALIAMQHSGSIRYYAHRVTVRYDLLHDGEIDAALSALRELGYRPYLVLEPFEVEDVRRRHGARSEFGALDWPPITVVQSGNIRIYDPADRQPFLAGRAPLTEIVR